MFPSHLGGLLRHIFLEPNPRVSDLACLRWGPGIGFSQKFTVNVYAVGVTFLSTQVEAGANRDGMSGAVSSTKYCPVERSVMRYMLSALSNTVATCGFEHLKCG